MESGLKIEVDLASDEAVVERLRQALSRAAILRQETGSVWVSDLRRLLAILDTLPPSSAPLLEALEEVLAVAELYVPVPLSAPGFKRARAALAAAKVQQEKTDG